VLETEGQGVSLAVRFQKRKTRECTKGVRESNLGGGRKFWRGTGRLTRHAGRSACRVSPVGWREGESAISKCSGPRQSEGGRRLIRGGGARPRGLSRAGKSSKRRSSMPFGEGVIFKGIVSSASCWEGGRGREELPLNLKL